MKRRLLHILLPLLLLTLTAPRLFAHGGGEIQLANEPIGPYKVTIWLNPPAPQAAQTLHVTVGIAAPPDDAPVLNAAVRIEVVDALSGEVVLTTSATTAASTNKLFYETDFELPDSGTYHVNTIVDAPDGGGTAVFPMEVSPASNTPDWLLIGGVFLGVVVLFSLLRNRHQNEA